MARIGDFGYKDRCETTVPRGWCPRVDKCPQPACSPTNRATRPSASVIGRFAWQSILAAAREIAEFDRCFGVPRQAQHSRRFVGCLVDRFQLREDRVGLLDLFLGLHLATLVR